MKKNEQVLEAWLQMTTVINNERITPDLPYNESMLKIYKTQHEKILKIVDELFDKIGYERQSEVIKLFDLITQTAKEML